MFKHFALGGAVLALTACGGGGTSNGGPDSTSTDVSSFNNLQEKTFLDSAVEGLGYMTPSASGETTASGGYQAKPGEPVRFFLKGANESDPELLLGEVFDNGGVLTPLAFEDLDSIATQTNMVRFLQTLDNDLDASNGIKIDTAKLQSGYENIDFSQSADDFATANSAYNLVELKVAIDHINSTLDSESTRNNADLVSLKNTVWEWTGTYPLGCTTGGSIRKSTGTVTWGATNGSFEKQGDWDDCDTQRANETIDVSFTPSDEGHFFDCDLNGLCKTYDLNETRYWLKDEEGNDCSDACVVTKSFNRATNTLSVKTDFLNGKYIYDVYKLKATLDLEGSKWYMRGKWDHCEKEDQTIIEFTSEGVTFSGLDGANLTDTSSSCETEDLGSPTQSSTYVEIADDRETWPCDPRACPLDKMTGSYTVNGEAIQYRYDRKGTGLEDGALLRFKTAGQNRHNQIISRIN